MKLFLITRYILIAPLALTSFVILSSDPIKEQQPATDGFCVVNTAEITNPHNLPAITNGECYTTFVTPEAGSICFSHNQLAQKSKSLTSPCIVQSTSKKTRKETGAAITADGINVIDCQYSYNDANFPKESNVRIVKKDFKDKKNKQHIRTYYEATTETPSITWVPQTKPDGNVYKTDNGITHYKIKFIPENKRTPLTSPEETSKQILALASHKVIKKTKEHQQQIDHLQARIDRLQQKNLQYASIYNKSEYKYSDNKPAKKCRHIEDIIRNNNDDIVLMAKEKAALLVENNQQLDQLKRNFVVRSASLRKISSAIRSINLKELEQNKKNTAEKSILSLFTIKDHSRALEHALLYAAQEIQDERNEEIAEYNETAPYLSYFSGPAIITKEAALKTVIQKTELNEHAQNRLLTKLKDQELPKGYRKNNKTTQELVTDLASQRSTTENIATIANEYLETSVYLDECERAKVEHLDFITQVLPAMLKHYEQQGKSSDECYNMLFGQGVKKERKNITIAFYKELIAKK